VPDEPHFICSEWSMDRDGCKKAFAGAGKSMHLTRKLHKSPVRTPRAELDFEPVRTENQCR